MTVLGCVADDCTGGTDVAVALRRAGLRTVLFFGEPRASWSLDGCAGAVVALKSRGMPAEDAAHVSLAVYRWLRAQAVPRVYVKYCSTFDSTDRGNIGPVADALLDASGAGMTVVCPASPEHGRTVYKGHLFVGDQLLSESAMRHHPLTPMTDSSLVRVLGRQTRHRVALVPHETVRRGARAVSARLHDLAAEGIRYAVTDAIDDTDLRGIAEACLALPVTTGAAGLARALGALLSPAGAAGDGAPAPLPDGPAVILAGSCSPATLAQVHRAGTEFPAYRLDPGATADPEELRRAALRWLDAHLGRAPLLIYSSVPPGQRHPDGHVAQALEQTMGALARYATDRGVRRLIVAGGETAGAVIDALGIHSVEVGQEVDRGVAWTVSAGEPRLALLLKSGNFGGPDLFLRAAGTVG
jgi:uncharacterized protein YgbK (DUF1537 family)